MSALPKHTRANTERLVTGLTRLNLEQGGMRPEDEEPSVDTHLSVDTW